MPQCPLISLPQHPGRVCVACAHSWGWLSATGSAYVLSTSQVGVLGAFGELGPRRHGDDGIWAGVPTLVDLSRLSSSVLRSQLLEPGKGQRAGLPGICSRCGHMFPAQGLWASGAPAKLCGPHARETMHRKGPVRCCP